jgi:hypothetical protein
MNAKLAPWSSAFSKSSQIIPHPVKKFPAFDGKGK